MNNPLPNVSNEKDILARIGKARGAPELIEPTETPLDLEVKPDEVEVEEVEEFSETLETEVETVEEDAAELSQEDIEELYIDLDGEEVSLNSVREWKSGNLMQSDYTRKTQALADDRKLFETEKESIVAKNQQLDDSLAQLKVFIDEFDQTEIDGYTLEELRDIDPGQYLKVTEQQAKRKEAFKKAKGLKAESSDADAQVNAKQAIEKLAVDNNWLKDGKQTAAYEKDTTIVKNYLTGLGYTDAMMQGVLTTGNGQVFIDAAKYHASKSANAAITKKVRKAPVITKPGGASKSVATSNLEKAKANHKKFGTVESAMALRKAQNQFKGK